MIHEKYKFNERIVKCIGCDSNLYTLKAIRNSKMSEYEILIPVDTEVEISRYDLTTIRLKLINKGYKSKISGDFDQLYCMTTEEKDKALSILKSVVANCNYVDIFITRGKIYNVCYDYDFTLSNNHVITNQYIKLWTSEYPEEDFIAYKNNEEDKYNDL